MPITQIDSSSTAIRNRILDAAVACLSDFGHARTTMQEIATRSGLSRTWVYKQFNNRNDVLAAVLRRELASFYGDLKIKLDVQSKTDELIVEIIVGFVDLSRNNQLFIRLWTLERDLVISWMTVESEFLLRISSEILTPYLNILMQRKAIRQLDLNTTARWIIRVAVMFVLYSDRESVDSNDIRRFVRDYIVNGLSGH